MSRSRIASGAVVAAVSAAALLVPALADAKSSVACQGDEISCIATVSLTGGASSKKVTVDLPGTSLKRWATVAAPKSVQGAYSISSGAYSLGGSVYSFTLNAVQSIGKGANVQLTFVNGAAKNQGTLTCPSSVDEVARIKITALGNRQARGAFDCKQGNLVGAGWMKRFGDGYAVKNFTVSKSAYSCRLVAAPRNTRCYGGGTRVDFDTPTGK